MSKRRLNMASTIDSITSTLGIDKVNMNGKLILIEEQHPSNANFVMSSVLSNAIKKGQCVCLVLFHNTFQHYQNVGMRFGYNLTALKEKGKVIVIDAMKILTSDIENMCQSAMNNETTLLADTDNVNMHTNIVYGLFTRIKQKYCELAQHNNNVALVLDDISHLLDIGLNVKDCMYFIRYIRSFLESQSTSQLCILIHTYQGDPHNCASDMISNGLKYMAHLYIMLEPLKTGPSGDASGKVTVWWRMESVRKEYHWPEKVMHLYKSQDWQVRVYAPGSAAVSSLKISKEMGIKQSIYEKTTSRDYFKLSREEYLLVKNVWTGIENNPQVYGRIFFTGFCERYPQYVKYYTLDPHPSLNFDARTIAKFTTIMEAMGYILLDFHNKPKQLDRLIGYIAMVHKDMRLSREDMFNFKSSLIEYLAKTFRLQMTAQCKEAITNYLNSVVNEIYRKMNIFRDYDTAPSHLRTRGFKSPCGHCTLFGDNLIYGQTKIYWNEWKKQWDEYLNDWSAQSTILEPIAGSSTDEEDATTQKTKTNNGMTESVPYTHQRSSILIPYDIRESSGVSASRIALMSLSKKHEAKTVDAGTLTNGRKSVTLPEQDVSKISMLQHRSSRFSYGDMNPRERHRAQSLVREALNPQNDATVLRRRVRSSRTVMGPMSSQTLLDKEESESRQTVGEMRKFTNTARERRRETQQFSFDLK